MAGNDFEIADGEAKLLESQVLPSVYDARVNVPPRSITELRDALIKKYHSGAASLVARLKTEGKDSLDGMIVALVDEVIRETDSLLGNELVATENGNLRDASVISFKRAEVLEKAIKAVQAKQVFERESGVDVHSPLMMIVFKFFMEKVNVSLQKLGYEDEARDIFFKTLGSEMANWQKELQGEFASS